MRSIANLERLVLGFVLGPVVYVPTLFDGDQLFDQSSDVLNRCFRPLDILGASSGIHGFVLVVFLVVTFVVDDVAIVVVAVNIALFVVVIVAITFVVVVVFFAEERKANVRKAAMESRRDEFCSLFQSLDQFRGDVNCDRRSTCFWRCSKEGPGLFKFIVPRVSHFHSLFDQSGRISKDADDCLRCVVERQGTICRGGKNIHTGSGGHPCLVPEQLHKVGSGTLILQAVHDWILVWKMGDAMVPFEIQDCRKCFLLPAT